MKTCTATECNYPVFSKKLCRNHWGRIYGKPLNKTKKPISKTLTNKGDNKYQAKRELGEFFAEMSNRLPGACESCGERFGYVAPHLRYWYVAHILPKKEFPSVATEELNIFFLNPFNCNCHGNWDVRGSAKRSTMGCYELALKRLKMFAHKLTGSEPNRAKKYLNIDL